MGCVGGANIDHAVAWYHEDRAAISRFQKQHVPDGKTRVREHNVNALGQVKPLGRIRLLELQYFLDPWARCVHHQPPTHLEGLPTESTARLHADNGIALPDQTLDAQIVDRNGSGCHGSAKRCEHEA